MLHMRNIFLKASSQSTALFEEAVMHNNSNKGISERQWCQTKNSKEIHNAGGHVFTGKKGCIEPSIVQQKIGIGHESSCTTRT